MHECVYKSIVSVVRSILVGCFVTKRGRNIICVTDI